MNGRARPVRREPLLRSSRSEARRLAHESLARGDSLGWFETLYANADGEARVIPWADMTANPNFVQWVQGRGLTGAGKRAIKVGCGLGDDAEEMARLGFDVVAFDISETAIAWCRNRFPKYPVHYRVADLFASPESWNEAFDFVLESYTLQVLPPDLREPAMECIARYVAKVTARPLLSSMDGE